MSNTFLLNRISGSSQITWPVWIGFSKGSWPDYEFRLLTGASIDWEPSGSALDTSHSCGYLQQDGTWKSSSSCSSSGESHGYVCEMSEISK